MQEPVTAMEPETTDAAPSVERVARLRAALASGLASEVRGFCHEVKAPDLADMIELLAPEERVELIQRLGADFDPEVLSELDPSVRDQISEALPNAVLAKAVSALDTDDAAYVIEGLEEADKQDVLSQISTSDRAALERNLEYPEETAGRLMQTDFVAVPPFWSVGQVIDHMREAKDLPETFSDIIVVDPSYRVLGSLDLSRLLRSKRHVGVASIMDTDRHEVLATADQEQMARQFERYDLKSAPVVDENKRLVGVVTVDDVVEVIEEETGEDYRLLAGVGDERMSDSVLIPTTDTIRTTKTTNGTVHRRSTASFTAESTHPPTRPAGLRRSFRAVVARRGRHRRRGRGRLSRALAAQELFGTDGPRAR